MIYKLGDSYIDLSKLEYISQKQRFESREFLYFQYQINGTLFTSDEEEYSQYDDFINAWVKYKDQL